uniref:Aminotransferase-like plant mobile domain-containing protein n=1 Tax=Fagus sylvatica TaxID=28930 RepID=A0A2N9H2I7_FAGSY
MASSSKKPVKGRGGSSSGKGGTSGGRRVPRGSEDDSSGSDSVLGSPEPHGDVLGRPTMDLWYRSGERFPSVPSSLQPPPADWEWLVMREDAVADVVWTPNFQEIRDLQIQKNEMLAVPLVFDFQCSRAVEWADWIDSELVDRGFCDRLEQAGVLRSILISRCSNMYRDTEALRQLVRRWCPSTHTFFFAHGEMTVTLEDIENQWLLPILGDQDPAEIALSSEKSKIKAVLADYIGRKNVALGTQAARFNSWMEHFLRIEDPLIRRAAFVSYWLSKCVFGEHPAFILSWILLHAEELAGASCHIVSTAFNSSIVHTFIWEHALEYIRKGKKPYEVRKKFASMPEGVVANVGDFQEDVPTVFRWVGNKFYDHSLIPSLDSEGKVCWRPYGITHRGFVYESVMSGFRDVEAQDYTLIAGDVASLTYLSATNAGWLLVLSPDGPQFTTYSAHRVRRQFGFDQEIPAIMGVAAGEIPTINPFLRARAFTYWSSVAPRVIVPNGNRVGVHTAGMANYWRGLMAAMVEFRDSGREDISHLLESYTSPLPHPRLFGATNTMTTYANRQSLGYAVWHHEDSRWVIYGNHHPPLWLRDHPHITAPGKVPSSKGKRNVSAGTPIAVKRKQPDRSKKGEAVSKDSPAQASKKQKTSAANGSKKVLTLKTVVVDPPPAEEDIPEGVSAPVSRKPVRKTRAGKRTFVPPTFPSAPSSIAARVAARKSSRGVVYSEKRSKQRADAAARIPIEIPDDLSSSSSSSDKDDPSGAAAKEIESGDTETAAAEKTESKDTEAAAAETVSGADDFTADISSADIGSLDTDAIINASSEEKDVEAGASTEDDEVSMDELGAAGAASDSDSTASASKPKSAEGATEEHGTVGVVTGAEKVIETTSIAITSSGGTAQGGPSGSGSHMDPSLLDSSPSTRQYVRRARRGSLVSSDSERTASASARPLFQKAELFPQLLKKLPVGEEGSAHVSDVPEGVTQVEHVEVAASEEPVQADVTPGSGVPVIEEELAQGPADDIDMGDTHDSYDEVLAETEDNMAGVQAADIEVTAPTAVHTSSTKTAGSGNETVVEEEGRLQTAAVESAIRGQPGLLSAVRPATLGSSVLTDMDAFFREFDPARHISAVGVHVGSSLLTLLCCVLAHMEHTRLEDITEVHILEWKAVVQEAIEGGFKFGFILDYLRRLAHDMFSRRILAELRVAEARVAALRAALNTVAPNPWDLASARCHNPIFTPGIFSGVGT